MVRLHRTEYAAVKRLHQVGGLARQSKKFHILLFRFGQELECDMARMIIHADELQIEGAKVCMKHPLQFTFKSELLYSLSNFWYTIHFRTFRIQGKNNQHLYCTKICYHVAVTYAEV